jgi:hypothetical protein
MHFLRSLAKTTGRISEPARVRDANAVALANERSTAPDVTRHAVAVAALQAGSVPTIVTDF